MSWVRAQRPPAAPPDDPTLVDRQVRLLGGLLVVDLVGQRVAIPLGPLGQLPAVLLIGLVLCAVGRRRGLLAVDGSRLTLGLLALATTAATAAASLLVRGPFSVPSYAYLIAAYVPFVLVVAGPGSPAVFRRLLELFSRIAPWLAAAAVVQLLVQLVGWHHPDPVGSLLPSSLLQDGYNTGNPFYYGSPFYRTNGFVFLEPSFCSQFLGVAVLAQLWLGGHGRRVLLLLAGMLTTVTGTGPVLLVAGLVVAAAVGQQGVVRRLGPALIAAVTLAVLTPLGALLTARATEGGSQNTSTGQRFVLPFVLLVPGWLASLPQALLGAGPGSVKPYLDAVSPDVAVVPMPPLKLLFEYGALGGVVFALFLGWCVAASARSASLTAGVVVAYLFLSGALQAPHMVLLLWLLVGVCQRHPREAAVAAAPPSPLWRVGGLSPGLAA